MDFFFRLVCVCVCVNFLVEKQTTSRYLVVRVCVFRRKQRTNIGFLFFSTHYTTTIITYPLPALIFFLSYCIFHYSCVLLSFSSSFEYSVLLLLGQELNECVCVCVCVRFCILR